MELQGFGLKGVNRALESLTSLATPRSQLKLAYRGATSQDRFLWVALRDGRWLAMDRAEGNKAYLLSKRPLPATPEMPLVVELQNGDLGLVENYQAFSLQKTIARDGEYQLQRSGRIQVSGGKVAGVSGTPQAVAAPIGLG